MPPTDTVMVTNRQLIVSCSLTTAFTLRRSESPKVGILVLCRVPSALSPCSKTLLTMLMLPDALLAVDPLLLTRSTSMDFRRPITHTRRIDTSLLGVDGHRSAPFPASSGSPANARAHSSSCCRSEQWSNRVARHLSQKATSLLSSAFVEDILKMTVVARMGSTEFQMAEK